MVVDRRVALLALLAILVLAITIQMPVYAGPPIYTTTVTGDLTGVGQVWIKGKFLYMWSSVTENSYVLIFPNSMNGFAGTHYGHIAIWREEPYSNKVEILFTYNVDNVYYLLSGNGTIYGDPKGKTFTIDFTGTFILKSQEAKVEPYIVWSGNLDFTITGQKT